jgi:LemA protein
MFIVLISILFAAVSFIWLYNTLIFRKNAIEQSVGGIQAYIQKRSDLIPALVATIEEFAQHEKSLLTEITELRTSALNPKLKPEEQIQQADLLSASIKRLMVSVEQYPNIKSSENFRQLQDSLSDIEEQLSAARRAYNASVVFYNNGIEMIPHKIVASLMGLQKKAVFEAPDHQQDAVNVQKLFNNKRS